MGDIDNNLPCGSAVASCIFPWGNIFSKEKANTKESMIGSLERMDAFPMGQSEQGVFDLAGSLEEWTSTKYYPYQDSEFIFDHIAINNQGTYVILRGGSYLLNADLCIASRRHGYRSDYDKLVTGLRCVFEEH